MIALKKVLSLLLSFLIVILSAVSSFAAEAHTDKIEKLAEDIFGEQQTVRANKSDTTEENIIYLGDANTDGKVTTQDARIILRFSLRLEKLTKRQCVFSDYNDSGYISSADARLVLRTALRLEPLKIFNTDVSEPDTVLSAYDNRRDYIASTPGFSTNIRNPKQFDSIKKLEKYCASFGDVITFYYTDTEQKYYIQYNSDRIYRTQSTVKAPYVKSMLVYMEENNIPLTTRLKLSGNQKWSGHMLSNYPSGTYFTIEELIEYTIRYSDNTAYQMLFDYFGTSIFNKNAQKIGSSLRLGNYIFGSTSAKDMAKLFLDIYNYNGRYKDLLQKEMELSEPFYLIKNGIPLDVRSIHKFGCGGASTVGYHDCAVVYTDKPFVLTVFTSLNTDRNYYATPFGEIGLYCHRINTETVE